MGMVRQSVTLSRLFCYHNSSFVHGSVRTITPPCPLKLFLYRFKWHHSVPAAGGESDARQKGRPQ